MLFMRKYNTHKKRTRNVKRRQHGDKWDQWKTRPSRRTSNQPQEIIAEERSRNMDWDNARVIKQESNRHHCWIREAIEIRKQSPRERTGSPTPGAPSSILKLWLVSCTLVTPADKTHPHNTIRATFWRRRTLKLKHVKVRTKTTSKIFVGLL